MINNKIFIKIISSIVLISIIISCTSRKELNYTVSEKKHETAQLIKDVDFTYQLLKDGHPGLYWFINKTQLDFKFDSLKKTITIPLTTKEFFKKLAPVVAQVKCGHTKMLLVTKKLTKKEQDSVKKLGVKPLNQFGYKIVNNKLYITSFNASIKNIKKGNEIVAINDIPATEIISNLKANIPSDGYNQTFKNASLNRSFINIYSSFYDNKDLVNFKIKNNKDSVIDLKLTTYKKPVLKDSIAVKKKTKEELTNAKKIANEKRKLNYKGYDELKKPILDLKFLEKDSSIAYLRVKSFSFPNANFERFYKESFKTLKNGKTKDLILDLRDNGGGSLKACRDLFSYLVDKDFVYLQETTVNNRFNPYLRNKGVMNKLKAIPFQIVNTIILKKDKDKYKLQYTGIKPLHANKNNYNGKVYVLINGYSFSASALLSANLKQINRATFVGQETGGGYNGCVAGSIPIISLPNSKLKLRMGLYPVMPNAHTDTIGRGIFPDVEITNTIEDIIAGKDNELDWVLKEIKKKV
jgi:C-terminal processing protease CtpA/Prc